MNFENYNKIYQEILDDEKNELSANYLLNKYKIKHDEELINILNQIKKNEYISAENTAINKLLAELDDNDDLLDINEIIEIKDKVITENIFDNLDEDTFSTVEEKEDLQTKQEKDTVDLVENKSKINYDNFNINFNIKYSIITVSLLILVSIYFLFPSSNKNTIAQNENLKTENIYQVKINQTNIESIEKKTALENIPEESVSKELPKQIEIAVKEDIAKDETQNLSEGEKVDKKIDKIEQALNENITPEKEENAKDNIAIKDKEEYIDNIADNQDYIEKSSNNLIDTITLESINDLDKYQNQFKYFDGKLVFNEKAYVENDLLFGFKIYKLTPLYVKFQDEKNHIRKRILF